jgi:kynureninase
MDTSEAHAKQLDAEDPLASLRASFHIPRVGAVRATLSAELRAMARPAASPRDEEACVYLVGNSLGCQPVRARELVNEELDDWRDLGVEGHLDGRRPWLRYHEQLSGPLARLVGASEREVVAMGTLTMNLHALMASFYRPVRREGSRSAVRDRILIEDSAFPSDSHAVMSQASWHGLDPRDAVVRVKARAGESNLRTEDVIATIEREGERLGLVLLGGVNYLSGQRLDMAAITAAGRGVGAIVGWDLAHAIGNVPLALHEWGADFAAWCSYKYLNAGPGAVAGAFVHERHLARADLVQLAGWWGNDPSTRFAMGPDFVPVASADRWQVSNPPILSMTPLIASLELFDRVGMPALRTKSEQLTGYLEALLAARCEGVVEVLTPSEPAHRGCALSLRVRGGTRAMLERLKAAGVVCDFRAPDVLRAAPVPMYSSYRDVWRFVEIVRALSTGGQAG